MEIKADVRFARGPPQLKYIRAINRPPIGGRLIKGGRLKRICELRQSFTRKIASCEKSPPMIDLGEAIEFSDLSEAAASQTSVKIARDGE